LVFYERLIQFYYPDNDSNEFGDLSHEVQYNVKEWEFYNSFIYSYEFNKFTDISSGIRWRDDGYGLSLTHSYQKLYSYDENDEVVEQDKNNGINLDITYKITSKIGLVGGFIYDIDKAQQSQWKLGMTYNRDCWNLAIGFRQDVKPTATASGADSILDNSFSFQLNFVPFGGIGFSSDDMKQYE